MPIDGANLKKRIVSMLAWTLLLLNITTAVILSVASYFQYSITKHSENNQDVLKKWNHTRSWFFLLQVILWCLNVVILFLAVRNIRNGLRSIERLKKNAKVKTGSLVQLLITMVTFTVSWFPLLYIEILKGEDDGTVYLVSIIINICALFCGMCIMFKLLLRMSLDAIEQLESNEICNEVSIRQSISNFD